MRSADGHPYSRSDGASIPNSRNHIALFWPVSTSLGVCLDGVGRAVFREDVAAGLAGRSRSDNLPELQ